MRAYEAMVVLKPDLPEEQNQAVIDKLTNLIQNQGGTVEATDKWGKRRLAYEIDKFREGFYVLFKFSSPAKASREFERVLKITDEVIRYLLVRRED